MTDRTSDMEDRLRTMLVGVARTTDAPDDWDAIRTRISSPSRSRSHKLLAAAAMVVVVAGAAGVAVTDDDGRQQVVADQGEGQPTAGNVADQPAEPSATTGRLIPRTLPAGMRVTTIYESPVDDEEPQPEQVDLRGVRDDDGTLRSAIALFTSRGEGTNTMLELPEDAASRSIDIAGSVVNLHQDEARQMTVLVPADQPDLALAGREVPDDILVEVMGHLLLSEPSERKLSGTPLPDGFAALYTGASLGRSPTVGSDLTRMSFSGDGNAAEVEIYRGFGLALPVLEFITVDAQRAGTDERRVVLFPPGQSESLFGTLGGEEEWKVMWEVGPDVTVHANVPGGQDQALAVALGLEEVSEDEWQAFVADVGSPEEAE